MAYFLFTLIVVFILQLTMRVTVAMILLWWPLNSMAPFSP